MFSLLLIISFILIIYITIVSASASVNASPAINFALALALSVAFFALAASNSACSSACLAKICSLVILVGLPSCQVIWLTSSELTPSLASGLIDKTASIIGMV